MDFFAFEMRKQQQNKPAEMKSIVASALDRNRHIRNSRALTSKFTMILKSHIEMQLAYATRCTVVFVRFEEFLSGL